MKKLTLLIADGRIRENTEELAAALSGMQIEDVTVLFKEATEHRAVLVLRGSGLSMPLLILILRLKKLL